MVLREFYPSVAKDVLLIASAGLLDMWLTLTISNDFTSASASDFRRHLSLQITSFTSFATESEE